MKNDEVAMLKSTGIKIDDDKTLVAIVDYHTEKELGFDGKEHVSKGKSFYRTDLIVRTNQEWKDLIAKFEGDPGREFKWTDMGLEIPGGEWRCWYSRKRWTWKNAAHWLDLKIRKPVTHDSFKAKAFLGKEPFSRDVQLEGRTFSLEDESQLRGLIVGKWASKIVREPNKLKALKSAAEALVRA